MSKKTTKDKSNKMMPKSQFPTWPFYVFIIIFVILYIALFRYTYLAVAFGAVAFILIIIVVALEVMSGAKESGYKKSMLEIFVAVIVVIIFWIGLQAALKTSYPLDVVPSCSMLSYLKRGDMVVLHGANTANLKAPIVNVTYSAFQSSFSNASGESFDCIAYNVSQDSISSSQFMSPGYSIGLYKQVGQTGDIIPYSYENSSLVKYYCGLEDVKFDNGTVRQEVTTNSIKIGNTTIVGDANNTVVVYKTEPGDLFYQEGDTYIIHRLYAIINVSGKYYFLTKGDNNPGLDIQYDNLPPSSNNIEGKVIAVIPYLGYLKLILSSFSGNGPQTAGCNYSPISN